MNLAAPVHTGPAERPPRQRRTRAISKTVFFSVVEWAELLRRLPEGREVATAGREALLSAIENGAPKVADVVQRGPRTRPMKLRLGTAEYDALSRMVPAELPLQGWVRGVLLGLPVIREKSKCAKPSRVLTGQGRRILLMEFLGSVLIQIREQLSTSPVTPQMHKEASNALHDLLAALRALGSEGGYR